MKNKVTWLVIQALCIALLFAATANAHKQHVHQYVAREAYLLLKSTLGGVDIPEMAAHLGPLEDPVYIGTRQWEKPYITTGAWREDEEDVVFGLRDYVDPFSDGALISISHFWDADNGDESQNVFRYSWNGITGEIGPYPNAFQKIKKYAIPNRSWILKWLDGNHGHVSTFDLYGGGTINYTWFDQIGFEYLSLPDLYKTGQAWVVGYYDELGQWIDHNVRPDILPRHVVLGSAPGGYREKLVWEILGRMCHLLADMAVPAHAHRDEHGLDPDSYEDWVGGLSRPYLAWNSQNVGNYIENPYSFAWTDEDRLHYLMYPNQEISDHFGSNGPYDGEGNDIIGGNPRSYEASILNSIIPTIGAPTSQSGPFTIENLTNILNKTFPRAIRSTAGLMYWFAIECELLKRVTVANDFGGGRLRIDGITVNDVPIGGIPFGWFSNSWHNIYSENGQHVGNYTREFQRWLKNGVDQGSSNPRDINVTADAQWKATSKRWFDVILIPAVYFEGGGGATYKVNGTPVGESWVGHDVVLEGSSILLEAVPPSTDWVFGFWSDDGADMHSNPRQLIPGDHTTLYATFKKHLFTQSSSGTAPNNQRKIAQSSTGTYCMVYESGNRVWFSKSSNGGQYWSNDFPVSDGGIGSLNAHPSVVVKGDVANVVWQSIDWWGPPFNGNCYIYLRRYVISTNTWSPLEQIATFVPTSQDFPATPVIDAHSLSANGSSQELKRIAWKDPSGIKVINNNYGSWSSVGLVAGTHGNCFYPSIVDYNGSTYALCWEDASAQTIRYRESYYAGSWSWPNAAQVSPYGWYANQHPSMAVGYGSGGCTSSKVSVTWQSLDNVVEGVSVHVRQANLGCNNWSPTITSYSMGSGGTAPHPVLGSYQSNNQLRLLWNETNNIYFATFNGTSWSGPSLLASGTDGGTECSMNSATPSVVAAVWRKPNGQIAVTIDPGSMSQSAGDGPFATAGDSTTVSYRRNRHGMVRISDALVQGKEKLDGMLAFEIAGMKLVNAEGEVDIPLSEDSPGRKSILSSEPFTVATGATLHFAGAAYGKRLAVPKDSVRSINQPIARVRLRQESSGTVQKPIWTVPFSDLETMQDSVFGVFRTFAVDLNDIAGRRVYVDVEMIGNGKMEPLIDDDYLILSGDGNSPKVDPFGKIAEEAIPQSHRLHQNYPNPFNPSTTFRFDLPEAQIVSLKVFNILGQDVMTVAGGLFEAGKHSVHADFSTLPSGMYVYRINAGKFSDVKKLILIR